MRLYRVLIAPAIVNRRAVPGRRYLTIRNQKFATNYLLGSRQANITRCSQRDLRATQKWLMRPATAVSSAINQ
jgi:hypothetical protein